MSEQFWEHEDCRGCDQLEKEIGRLEDQLQRTQGYESGFVENLKILEQDNEAQARRINELELELRDWRYLGASWHKRHGKYHDIDLDRLMRKAREKEE